MIAIMTLVLWLMAGISLAQTYPSLPVLGNIRCGESAGSQATVTSGGDLQAAIDAAPRGRTIYLEAGGTYAGPVVLKSKDGTGCITIRTNTDDDLLPSYNRVAPGQVALMAKITAPGSNLTAIETEDGASYYKLIGLEITPVNGAAATSNLIVLGSTTQSSLSQVPHHIELDRLYVHSAGTSSLKRCIELNSASTTIKNSYVSGCKNVGQDAQAIAGWNGPGPYSITNNYLEGSTENVLFGGADTTITNLIPSDIYFGQNYVAKPFAWRNPNDGLIVANGAWDSSTWAVKNLFELKSSKRVLIEGNIFEGSWPQGQSGYALVVTVRNQDGANPWNTVEDVTVRHNIVKDATQGMQLFGADDTNSSQSTKRIHIHNNLWRNIGYPLTAVTDGYGRGILVINDIAPVANLIVEHNTFFQLGIPLSPGNDSANSKNTGLYWRNNIHWHNDYGILGAGVGTGNPTLNGYFTSPVYLGNAMVEQQFPASYPAGNFDPANLAAVGFTGVSDRFGAGTDWGLTGGSSLHNAGTDGTDVGINWPTVQTETSIAVSGIPGSGCHMRVGRVCGP